MKTKRRPDASSPPARRGAASPRRRSPGSTSPPSMKLSKPHSGTGVPPNQWDRGSGAGARGGRPRAAAREAGAEHGRGERAPTRGAGAQAEARPLPRAGPLSVLSPGLGAFPPLLAPADPQPCSVRSF